MARSAASLKILSASAARYIVTGLMPKFKRDTGLKADCRFATIAEVLKRLGDGESADVIIGTTPAIAQLDVSGALEPGSRAEIGRTLTGLGVREGTPPPDISTPEKFRQALLDAGSLAYTDPERGGSSGLYLVGLLERLGIYQAVRAKALPCRDGDEVVDKVLAGEAELASTFLSEIVPRPGMVVVGPYPAAIAHGMSYAAGIAAQAEHPDAARKFIALITDRRQSAFLVSRGFQPPTR